MGGAVLQFRARADRVDDSEPQPSILPRELRLALWMRQISLDYQPIVDITTGDLAGVEAYVRWDRPGHGVVPARSFVDQASSALASLDQEVLWVSTSLWASLGGTGAHVPLHVNIGLGGTTRRLSRLVGRALSETRLDASLLQIDVADSIDPADDEARHSFEGLAEHGVRVALDDSGRLPVDELATRFEQLPFSSVKIDVRAGEDSEARVAAVAAAAAIAGVEATAKLVEDLDDLDRASAVGAHEAQGYVLGRPVSPEACVELVMADRRARSERVA